MTKGFTSPNYTQVPNDFFSMIPEMSEAELRTTLVLIRQTFGFHREEFKMGINKLAVAAGLSRNGAKDGAEAAEKRGTFSRTNPESLGEAEWSLVVTPSLDDPPPGQPVTTPWSTGEGQVGVKEIINKENKPESNFDQEQADLTWFIAHGKKITPKMLEKQKEEREFEEMLETEFKRFPLNWIAFDEKAKEVFRRFLKAEKKQEHELSQFVTWWISDEWRRANPPFTLAIIQQRWLGAFQSSEKPITKIERDDKGIIKSW